MKRRMLIKGSLAAVIFAAAAPVLAQTVPPTSGPAANGSPGWHLAPSYPDPTGHTLVDETGKVTVQRVGRGNPDPIRATDDVPGCRGAAICGRPAFGGRGGWAARVAAFVAAFEPNRSALITPTAAMTKSQSTARNASLISVRVKSDIGVGVTPYRGGTQGWCGPS